MPRSRGEALMARTLFCHIATLLMLQLSDTCYAMLRCFFRRFTFAAFADMLLQRHAWRRSAVQSGALFHARAAHARENDTRAYA